MKKDRGKEGVGAQQEAQHNETQKKHSTAVARTSEDVDAVLQHRGSVQRPLAGRSPVRRGIHLRPSPHRRHVSLPLELLLLSRLSLDCSILRPKHTLVSSVKSIDTSILCAAISNAWVVPRPPRPHGNAGSRAGSGKQRRL